MVDRLRAKIEELQQLVEEGSADVYAVSNFLALIPELFDKIAHGEAGHREWLKKAIEAHFLGEPMPEYVAK